MLRYSWPSELFRPAAIFLGTIALVVPAFGNILVIQNPSFEIVGGPSYVCCGVGSVAYTGAISGWVSTPGPMGEFQPGTQLGNFSTFNSLSDGITNAYNNGGTISQTVLGVSIVPGVTYMLQVDIGERKDNPIFGGSADLLINGHQYVASGAPPILGAWSTYTVSYLGTVADAGATITIELNNSYPSSPFQTQVNFDNVRLSAVPEPSSVVLLFTGGGAMGVFLLRRKTKASC